jgi:hypothetical protein
MGASRGKTAMAMGAEEKKFTWRQEQLVKSDGKNEKFYK